MSLPSPSYKTNFEPGNVRTIQTQIGAKSGEFMMVPIDDIIAPEGLNVRVQNEAYEDRIEEVTISIMENGFYRHKPLPAMIVKEGERSVIKITGGFTRLAAAKAARDQGYKIEKIPVVLHAPGTSDLDIQTSIFLDNTGLPLTPWEKGVIVKRLVGGGLAEPDISKKLSVSVTYVKDLLFLHSLPMSLQDLAMNNKVPASRVIKVVKKEGQEKALDLLITPAKRKSNGVTVRKALAAINYSCSLPTGGIEFLARWSEGDTAALEEVEATLRKPRKPRVSKRKKQTSDDDIDL